MNRFSTAHKLNKTSGIYNLKNANTYKQQLLDIIALQQRQSENNASSSSPPIPAGPTSVSVPSPQFDPSAGVADPPLPSESAQQFASNGNMKSKHFGNGDGELDMLFGFFIMNGACIVFFLLFGVCVICNCAARKPKFHGSEEKKKKPTVGRLVAAIAPGGFSTKAKAKETVATEKSEENGGNTPLLMPERPNLEQQKQTNEQRTAKSFKSLVVRAMAASRGEQSHHSTDVERQQNVVSGGAADAVTSDARPTSAAGVTFVAGAPTDRPPAQRCSPSSSRLTSGASSRRTSAIAHCCASVLTPPPIPSSSPCTAPPSADTCDLNNNSSNNNDNNNSNDTGDQSDYRNTAKDSNRRADSTPGSGGRRRNGSSSSRTTAMVTFAEPTPAVELTMGSTTKRGGRAVTERSGDEHLRMNGLRSGGRVKKGTVGRAKEEAEEEEEEVIFL